MQPIPFSQLIITILLTLSISHPSTSQQQCSSSADSVRAGYWLSQSNHYYPLSHINTSLYTHLHYYSLSIDETSFAVALPPPEQAPLLSTFSTTLKANNNSLRTLLSIATDELNHNSSNAAFSSMANDPNLRAAFINSTIQLARDNSFDGLDLAWQFPSSAPDMANLGTLLAEWRVRIDDEAQEQSSSPPLLLTATVYFSNHIFDGPSDDLYYPTDAMSSNLDWANALCFNYHKNSEVTAADAALYDKVSHFSTSYGITSWLDAGFPPCKLVMGIPLYGRSWFLKNKVKNGLGAPVVAAGLRQKLSNRTGIMAYFEIQQLLKDTSSAAEYDNNTVSAYFHTGGLWVSFDNPEVVGKKINFAMQNGLMGYFIWPISFDESDHSVSKQARDVWLHIPASGPETETVYGEALSPDELPPQGETSTTSAGFSGLRRGFPTISHFHLHSCFLLFLLFYV